MIVKSRIIRWVGLVECMGEVTSVCKILVEKPEKESSLGESKHNREDGIK
jgi:hypothetical protein